MVCLRAQIRASPRNVWPIMSVAKNWRLMHLQRDEISIDNAIARCLANLAGAPPALKFTLHLVELRWATRDAIISVVHVDQAADPCW